MISIAKYFDSLKIVQNKNQVERLKIFGIRMLKIKFELALQNVNRFQLIIER